VKILERYKVFLVVALLAFALGSYVANETGRRSERPMLRFISTAARWGLRALVFLDPPPPVEQQYQTCIGSDGYRQLDHQRSL
jgi:hypothetical protein